MARRFRNVVGPQVRVSRVAHGWTQDQLAARLTLAGLNFDRVTVAKIESQIRTVQDFELAILAQVLNVDVQDLIPSLSSIKSDLEALQRGERATE